MFFRTDSRIDTQTKEMYISYRLVESYRDIVGDTRHRTVLTVGRMDDITPEQLWAIADGREARYRGEQFLFAESPRVENYLSKKPNVFFDLQDKIFLFDLTNFYFEGHTKGNRKVRCGRSKEKRSDCSLVVLALVVNIEGFIKYSALYEGNRSDCSTLGDIIEELRALHENPVRAGIVEKAEDYLYSSARNYAELDAVLDVIIILRLKK